MKKILHITGAYFCLIMMFSSCAPMLPDERKKGVVEFEYTSWIGEYTFDEFSQRTDHRTGEWMPPFMKCHIINIYEWEGILYAYITVDGRMFSGRARAIIAYSENEIHLLYDENMKGGGNFAGLDKRRHLLSFMRKDDELITTWGGGLYPMMETNELPGVYFKFDPNAEFDTSVHLDIDPVVIVG